MGENLRAACISDGVVALRQTYRLSIRAIDLRLKEEVRSQALGGIRIEPVEPVANDKRSQGRVAGFVAHAQLDAPCRKGIEQYQNVITEANILAALPDIEADLRRALPAVAAIDLQNAIVQGQPGEPGVP